MALVVLTGGARSGKSAAAQGLALDLSRRGATVRVAVFARDDGSDPEFSERVARHRADRPDEFITIEAVDAVSWREKVDDESVLLLDCLGTLLGVVMEDVWMSFDASADRDFAQTGPERLPAGFEDAVVRHFDSAIDWLVARRGDSIIVTNEVGDGIVPTHATGRLFRDLLGRANRRLVMRADRAWLTVCGRLFDLSALPTRALWPED